MNIVIDEETPQNAPLAAKFKRSFAYPSMKDRCPVIVTKIVDQLHREKQALVKTYGEEAKEEIKQVIGEISQLKNVLQTGKSFESFTASSEPDKEIWNCEIQRLSEKGVNLNYYEADWLFAECYLYRKIREIFATKDKLKSFDPFFTSKNKLLNDSIPVIVPLIQYFEAKNFLNDSHILKKEELEKELTQLFKCILWSNRLDLSLSGGTANVEDTDIFKIIQMWDGNIIVNDLDKVLSVVTNSTVTKKTVAYVMDNSGMEALCDLCLADFLVSHCGVAEIKFRVKPIPWYVSDVTFRDFDNMLEVLSNHTDTLLKKIGDRWRSHLLSGKWSVESDIYWCLGLSYSQMADKDPELYRILSAVDLVIFKGDLNYRKLLQDINWAPTTPFSVALGKFHPAPLVTFRTNKAHLICGLKEGEAETLNIKDPKWMISGEFGVIQFDHS